MNSTTTLRAYDDDANRQKDIFSKDNALLTHLNNDVININGGNNDDVKVTLGGETIATQDATTHTKLDTLNTIMSYLSLDDNSNLYTRDLATHTKLDTINTNINTLLSNTPKTVRQFRQEGKCYSVSIQGWDMSNNVEFGYIYNPEGSGKNIYVYQISAGAYKMESTERVALDLKRANLISSTNGQNVTESNLDFSIFTGGVAEVVKRNGNTNFNISRSGVRLFESHGMNGNGGDLFVDYQEEMIRIPEGKGLILGCFVDGSASVNANVRYIETDEDL